MLKNLWLFSRPHTIIGSTVSIITLYILNKGNFSSDLWVLVYTLVSALGCNIFITGLNQIIDVDLDKINKPNLPLASGALTKANAICIVAVSAMISVVAAALCSHILLILILVIMALGIAYSVPPVQLKRHHVPAALAITIVRGLLVNLGMSIHFSTNLTYTYDALDCWKNLATCQMPLVAIIPLTIFVTAFSLAIAWFKDLPDTAGDQHFGYRTFPLLYSKSLALYLGAAIVAVAYFYCIYWAAQLDSKLLLIGHIVLALGFLVNVFKVRMSDMSTVKRFYMIFWVFFFAEYILFGIAGLM
jgi:homogentisate phytyltransferase / homogentisate geranylgeranyltransferase